MTSPDGGRKTTPPNGHRRLLSEAPSVPSSVAVDTASAPHYRASANHGGGTEIMRIASFAYAPDETVERGQVALISTVVGGTVLHHPDADDAEIMAGLSAVFDAIADRHGACDIGTAAHEIGNLAAALSNRAA